MLDAPSPTPIDPAARRRLAQAIFLTVSGLTLTGMPVHIVASINHESGAGWSRERMTLREHDGAFELTVSRTIHELGAPFVRYALHDYKVDEPRAFIRWMAWVSRRAPFLVRA